MELVGSARLSFWLVSVGADAKFRRSCSHAATVAGLSGLQTPEGYLRVSPLGVGTDGFFAAVLVKSLNPPKIVAPAEAEAPKKKAEKPKPVVWDKKRPRAAGKPLAKRKPRA